MFLEINVLVLVVLSAFFIAHEVVVQIDLRVAQPLRAIGTIEQQVHALLEAAPLAALAVIACLVLAEERYDFALSFKDPSPAAPFVWLVLTAMFVFGAIPYWEEFWRCLRVARTARRRA